MALSVIVWDQEDAPPAASEKVLCWQSYADGETMVSIPRYLEDHAARIRQKYLAFIHDLGEFQVAGKRVVDHLDRGDGFSLWWMTHLAEKSPLKSPRIYDCLRLLALEEILIEIRPSQLTFITSDKDLAKAMRTLCRHAEIEFRCQLRYRSMRVGLLRRLYDALPSILKGLVSIRHVVVRWPLRKLNRPQWFSGENALFICSYFIHLDPTMCAQGRFYSRQWESLPKSLHDHGISLNWVQLFLFSTVVPDLSTGLRWLRQINLDSANQGFHAFLESYMTFGLAVRVFKAWLRLNVISWHLRNIQSAFYADGSSAWLWPILRGDWQTSLNGSIAISNCFSIELFDAVLADIPQQRMGLYLCENQGWEKALLRAWRKNGHGKIVGVQHSTVPFWHLYNFDDPRSLRSKQRCALPLPDHLAVNGAAAWEALVEGSYPEERLVEVEALRYLNFAPIVKGAVGLASHVQKRLGCELTWLNVLVLGDMMPTSMHHFLTMLEQTCKVLPSSFRFTFKPHPGYSVNLAHYPGLKTNETKEPLSAILGKYDVAIAANSTSGSVDAYLAGIPVIVGLDGNELNLSPLRGRRGVRFVGSCADLFEALQVAARGAVSMDTDRANFFFLDSDLTRWKRLLAYGKVS